MSGQAKMRIRIGQHGEPIEVENCPYCGKEPTIRERDVIDYVPMDKCGPCLGHTNIVIECKEDNFSTEMDNEICEIALASWNHNAQVISHRMKGYPYV